MDRTYLSEHGRPTTIGASAHCQKLAYKPEHKQAQRDTFTAAVLLLQILRGKLKQPDLQLPGRRRDAQQLLEQVKARAAAAAQEMER